MVEGRSHRYGDDLANAEHMKRPGVRSSIKRDFRGVPDARGKHVWERFVIKLYIVYIPRWIVKKKSEIDKYARKQKPGPNVSNPAVRNWPKTQIEWAKQPIN